MDLVRRLLRPTRDAAAPHADADLDAAVVAAIAGARGVDDLLRELLRVGRERIGRVDQVIVWPARTHFQVGRRISARGQLDDMTIHAGPDTRRLRAATERRTLVVRDADAEVGGRLPVWSGLGARAAIFTPLVADDEVTGVVSFLSARPVDWTTRQIRIAERAAAAAASAVLDD